MTSWIGFFSVLLVLPQLWVVLVSASPTRQKGKCEAMRFSYVCNDEYTHTSFPNSLGHENQEIAYDAFVSHFYLFYLDRNTACHKDLEKFMCLLFFPKCTPSQTAARPKVEMPCRDLCKDVKNSCEKIIQQIIPSYEWEYDCEDFPGDSCVKAKRSRQRGIKYGLDTVTPLPERLNCRYDQFRCSDNRGCIPAPQRCDGIIDCRDMSDEMQCGYCGENAFQCQSGKCINHLQTCDGFDNCGDGSDEIDCARNNLMQTLINDMLTCDCSNTMTVVPSYTDICMSETTLKVRVVSVKQSNMKFRYNLRIERVLKGDRSLIGGTVNYEMYKVDGCECVKGKFPPRKQLYISGEISTLRKKKGKKSIHISDTGEGSFVLPINMVDAREFKKNIRDCRLHSRNFSRSLSNVKKTRKVRTNPKG